MFFFEDETNFSVGTKRNAWVPVFICFFLSCITTQRQSLANLLNYVCSIWALNNAKSFLLFPQCTDIKHIFHIISCAKKQPLALCVLGSYDIWNCCLITFLLNLNWKQCLLSYPLWKLLRFSVLPPMTKQGQNTSLAWESNIYYLCSILVTYILQSKTAYRCVGWQGLALQLCETCFHYSMRHNHFKFVLDNDSLYYLCKCDPHFILKMWSFMYFF